MSIATRIQSMNEHIEDAYNSLNKMGVTANNKNIENIAGLVNQIYENAPKTDYVSGVDLTIENTLKGKIDYKDTDSIEKIGFGNTSQTGTPTPSSPIDVQVVKGNTNVNISNKNLLNITATSQTKNNISFTINNDKTILTNGTGNSSSGLVLGKVNLISGQTYVLSGCASNGGSGKYTLSINDEGTLTRLATDTGSGITYTPSTSKTYDIVLGYWYGYNIQNLTFYPQIEVGSTATSYVAHQEQNYNINFGDLELCKIGDYQDYIFKQNGKWYKYKTIQRRVLDGTEGWNYNSDNTLFYASFSDKKPGTETIKNIYCDKLNWVANYANIAGAGAMSNLEIATNNNGTSKNVFIKNTSYQSAIAFREWLLETKPLTYYIKNDPVITEITSQPLITQLNNLYNAQSTDDITYITVDGNLPIQLKVKALKK